MAAFRTQSGQTIHGKVVATLRPELDDPQGLSAVELIDRDPRWVLVRNDDGQEAWLSFGHVEIVWGNGW